MFTSAKFTRLEEYLVRNMNCKYTLNSVPMKGSCREVGRRGAECRHPSAARSEPLGSRRVHTIQQSRVHLFYATGSCSINYNIEYNFFKL